MNLTKQILKDLESRRKEEKKQQTGISTQKIPPAEASITINNDVKKTRWINYLRLTLLIIGLIIVILIIFFTINFGASKKEVMSHINPKLIQTPHIHTVAEKTKQQLNNIITKTVRKMSPPQVIQNASKINIPYRASRSIRISKPISSETTTQQDYQAAMQKIKEGSTGQAISLLEGILKVAPDNKEARATLAAILIKQGKIRQARQTLIIGLQQNPHYINYAILQAHLLVQAGKIQNALNILKNAAPASISANPNYFAFMAALYLQQQEYSIASRFYQQLTKYNADNGKWWLGLGIAEQKLNQDIEASKAFKKAANSGDLSPSLMAYISTQMGK